MQNGRRPLVIFSNFMAIAFAGLSLVANTYVIAVARLGFGLASGFIIAASPKILDETIPAHLIDKGFGMSTNLLINFGVMVATVLAIGNPSEDDYDALNDSWYWRFEYGFAVVPAIISLVLSFTVHREDSLLFLI